MTTTPSGTQTFPTADWSTVAASWADRSDFVEAVKAELTTALLERLALRPGEAVLELGAGTGALATRLAAAVDPSGSVLATDVAPGMVELIRRRNADVANVDTAVVDAADITLPEASYDAVVFRMGLMFLIEPETALHGMRRVLKPGGRIAVSTWGAFEKNPWLTALGMSMMMNGLVNNGPPINPGGPLSLSSADGLAALAQAAGFTDIDVTEIETVFHYASVEDHIDTGTSLAPPLAEAMSAATVEQRAAVAKSVGELTAGYVTADGIDVPGCALLLTARR
jgi:enediyne biosynthesis protein CalE5